MSFAPDPGSPPPIHQSSRLSGHMQTWWVRLQPAMKQTWLNLKVWIPFLLNPAERARQVTYQAREHREGFNWKLQLPARCWKCQTPEGLWHRELEIEVRGFEHAISVVALTASCFLFFALFAMVFRSLTMLLLAIFSLLIGTGLLYVKSWLETVTLHMATCPTHADDMPLPEIATHDNELYVFMPNQQLAILAREELRKERQGRDRGLPGAAAESDAPSESMSPADRYRSPFGTSPTRAPDLPPIPLDDG